MNSSYHIWVAPHLNELVIVPQEVHPCKTSKPHLHFFIFNSGQQRRVLMWSNVTPDIAWALWLFSWPAIQSSSPQLIANTNKSSGGGSSQAVLLMHNSSHTAKTVQLSCSLATLLYFSLCSFKINYSPSEMGRWKDWLIIVRYVTANV